MTIYFTHISQFSEQRFFEFGQVEVTLGLQKVNNIDTVESDEKKNKTS